MINIIMSIIMSIKMVRVQLWILEEYAEVVLI